MVDNMRDLCHAVNCDFDRWYSERSLYVKDTEGETAGTSAVDRAFEKLDKMGYLYTKDGALWFRSTDLGDDKDRVLIKSDGEYTYCIWQEDRDKGFSGIFSVPDRNIYHNV